MEGEGEDEVHKSNDLKKIEGIKDLWLVSISTLQSLQFTFHIFGSLLSKPPKRKWKISKQLELWVSEVIDEVIVGVI
jgi:hypothetical protein